MLIDIHRIGGKGLLLDDRVELDPNYLVEDDGFFLDDIDYNIFFNRNGSRIKAKGRIRTFVSLKCVGCLENFDLKIDSKFDIILFPVDKIEINSMSLNPYDMEYIFYEGDKVDLSKILMEQVNLFIPYNPVCSPDCRGICPNCGVNLNNEKCKCEHPLNEMNFFFGKLKR